MSDEPAAKGDMSDQMWHRPSSHVISRRLGDETVLINLQSNRIYELNRTGARLWELLAVGSLEEARARLALEFEVDEATLVAEVDRLVAALLADGLVVLERTAPGS